MLEAIIEPRTIAVLITLPVVIAFACGGDDANQGDSANVYQDVVSTTSDAAASRNGGEGGAMEVGMDAAFDATGEDGTSSNNGSSGGKPTENDTGSTDTGGTPASGGTGGIANAGGADATPDAAEADTTPDTGGTGGSITLDERDDIVLIENFEAIDWHLAWNINEPPQNTSIVTDASALQGESFLRIEVPAGEHYGASFGYSFSRMSMDEPDEVFFRYAIRLGPTWTTDGGGGGKLPGFGGTYDTAGWGGRPSDGTNGWSARGLFWPPESGAETGATRIGYYCYHADMPGTYGDNWFWSGDVIGDNGVIERGRWYQIETFVRMNDPGLYDGILRAWVDGEQVYEKTDIRFRDVDTLHVQRVWFDLYYGGNWTAPTDMFIDFDTAVIAWNYIGPTTQ